MVYTCIHVDTFRKYILKKTFCNFLAPKYTSNKSTFKFYTRVVKMLFRIHSHSLFHDWLVTRNKTATSRKASCSLSSINSLEESFSEETLIVAVFSKVTNRGGKMSAWTKSIVFVRVALLVGNPAKRCIRWRGLTWLWWVGTDRFVNIRVLPKDPLPQHYIAANQFHRLKCTT